jgi:tetratricopeptide (TPR) repeat protein
MPMPPTKRLVAETMPPLMRRLRIEIAPSVWPMKSDVFLPTAGGRMALSMSSHGVVIRRAALDTPAHVTPTRSQFLPGLLCAMRGRRFLAGSMVAICVSAGVARGDALNPKVVERYKQMLAARPAEGTALDRLWQMFVEQNRTNELIEEYRAGETFASQMVLGLLLRKAARLDEAAAAFERAAELDTKSALPWLALAKLRGEQGARVPAAEAMEKAATALPERDPQLTEVLLQLGAAWLAAGDVAKATAAWERTVALDPKNLELRRRLAAACIESHAPERAIVHLEHLEQHAPPQERAQALQQLARVHQGAGNQDEAIAALERALTYTAPGNWLRAELQSQIIRLHQRYHRVPELEQRWSKYAATNPRDIAGYLQLIDLYERTGELDKLREWLGKVVALAPRNGEYRLKLARLLVHTDDLDGAAKLFDQLLADQPGSIDLVFERARLDIQRDQTEAARARIAKLVATAKDREAARAKALEFYEANRLHDLAEAHLREEAASGAEEPVMALVSFLFTQHRVEEARATLERLIPKDASPDAMTAALLKQAHVLKSQNELAAASAALRKVLAISPKSREPWMLLGEIETMLGHTPEARRAYEEAFAASATPAQAIEADQKLFETFRAEPEKMETTRRPFSPPPGFVERSGGNDALQSNLLNIVRAAAANPSVDGWLRAARWNLWARNVRQAADCAQRALAIDRRSVAAHEFMVKLASSEPRSGDAQAHLEELRQIDPARASEYRRRAGQLELQAGRVAEAAKIFSEIAAANPGNIEALTDLALTQQRAESWEAALATWQQIYTLSPASRKKEAIGSLLNAYQRLGRFQPAAELLLTHVDSLGDEKEQFAAFHDLLALCTQHGIIDWLRGEMERRRKTRGDDYFTEMALGRILKAMGNKAAAFEVLADASFAAPNQAEALPELVHEAEELRKLDAAVRLQTQLVRILPDTRLEPLAKLAQLEERNSDLEAAAKTWEKIVAKFPRDASALEQAVDFQTRWGEPSRAVELLRRLRAIDPGNVRALSQLAQLDIEAGEIAEAEQCLEQLLARSTPSKASETVRFPGLKPEDAARLQSTFQTTLRAQRGRASVEVMRALRGFWIEDAAPGRADTDVRLGAIRDLAKLVQMKNDQAAMNAWVSRWIAPNNVPTETLWALFFSGASGPLLDYVETRLAASPDESPRDAQYQQGFIWLALQTGEFERLSKWVHDPRRAMVDRDYLLVALGQYLQSHAGRIEPALIENLFPPGYKLRAWQMATLLGNRGNFREAAALGQRVFDGLTTQRGGYGVELAHWHLFLGDGDAARKLLRESLSPAGDSYETPAYSALRELWLLLPENERAVFAETFLEMIDPEKEPLHAALSGALLAGLAGDGREAHSQLARLLALGGLGEIYIDDQTNAAARYWDFVLGIGVRLQGWKLDALAVDWWEMALADEALIRLDVQHPRGDQVLARTNEIRARLTALQLQRASPLDAGAIISNYRRIAPPETLVQVADALETAGAYSQAILVHRAIWEREPGNPHALRGLLAACRAGSDNETLEEVLARCVREGFYRANEAVHRDYAMQLADLLERRGAYPQAKIILAEAIENAPLDAPLLQRLGQLHERAGRLPEAESAYQRLIGMEPGNVPARVALAGVLEAQERVPAAIDALGKSPGLDVDTKLVLLYERAGRLDDAIGTLERIAPPNHLSVALLLANRLVEKSNTREARNILRQALARTTEPRDALPVRSRLVELLSPDEDKFAIPREVQRLRKTAERADTLGAYFDLLVQQAPRLKYDAQFSRELEDDWDSGAGLAAAGVALLEWNLQKNDRAAAEATWARLLARDDFTEALWTKTIAILEKAALPELAVQAHARLARLAPLNYMRMFHWVQALRGLGRDAEALLVLDELSQRAILNDEIAAQAAKIYGEMTQPARARALFAQAVAGDPAARGYQTYLAFARLLIEQGDVSAARQQLRIAFRNPLNREFRELIAFIEKLGRLDHFDEELGAFDLRPQMLIAARRELFAHFEKSGNVAAAVALLDEHPNVMQNGVSARLRTLAIEKRAFEKVAALFEKLVAQSELANLDAASDLAVLCAAWGEDDLAHGDEDAALKHLTRSHELRKDLFAPLPQLTDLLVKRGDVPTAARALDEFIKATQNPAEKEKAEAILARIGK